MSAAERQPIAIVRDESRVYPCTRCGVMRSRSEGGEVFTVCDDCWNATMRPIASASAADEPREMTNIERLNQLFDACAAIKCGVDVHESSVSGAVFALVRWAEATGRVVRADQADNARWLYVELTSTMHRIVVFFAHGAVL